IPIGQADELPFVVVDVGDAQVAGHRQLGAQSPGVVFVFAEFIITTIYTCRALLIYCLADMIFSCRLVARADYRVR
ncbi:MAG: hypothetical protein CUN54_07650, partial [Phototrophicales bacterium]